MPSPISGVAQALQQATQTRIINLSPAIPSAIVPTAVLAIDNPNETYKLTLEELQTFIGVQNYLPLAGGTMAGELILSNTLSADDVCENADAGNIGKITPVEYTGDINNITAAGFYNIGISALNLPTGVISASTLIVAARNGAALSQMLFDMGTGAVFTRRKSGDAWFNWQEVATYDPADPETSGFLPLTGGTISGALEVEGQFNANGNTRLVGTSEGQCTIRTIDDTKNTHLRFDSATSQARVLLYATVANDFFIRTGGSSGKTTKIYSDGNVEINNSLLLKDTNSDNLLSFDFKDNAGFTKAKIDCNVNSQIIALRPTNESGVVEFVVGSTGAASATGDVTAFKGDLEKEISLGQIQSGIETSVPAGGSVVVTLDKAFSSNNDYVTQLTMRSNVINDNNPTVEQNSGSQFTIYNHDNAARQVLWTVFPVTQS